MKNKTNKNIQPLIDVALFAILIFSFHFFFRWWAYGDNKYWPIADIIYPVYDFLSNLLYVNSRWVLSHLTTIDFSFNDNTHTIELSKGYVSVNNGCSGLKQFLQWIVLMTLFPGPWKQKLWFIPLGIIIIHLVNIFRITTLSVILNFGATQTTWDFTHDWILRPFFYVVMFGMWVVWVEKFKSVANR